MEVADCRLFASAAIRSFRRRHDPVWRLARERRRLQDDIQGGCRGPKTHSGSRTMHTENPFAGKELVGGRICLDFANTLGQHEPEPLSEWLDSYDDLVWWALRADIVPEAEAEALFESARAHPAEAAEVFRRAIELREAVFRIF